MDSGFHSEILVLDYWTEQPSELRTVVYCCSCSEMHEVFHMQGQSYWPYKGCCFKLVD